MVTTAMRLGLILALVLLFSSCETEPDLLGLDYDASMSRLARSDYSFLSDVSASDVSADSVPDIEAGSAYYLGRIFEEKGRYETAFNLHHLQWESDDTLPWSYESGRRLVELARSGDNGNEVNASRQETALAVAEILHGKSPDDASLAVARADLLLGLERWEELSALEAFSDIAPHLYTRIAHGAVEAHDATEARAENRSDSDGQAGGAGENINMRSVNEHLRAALTNTPRDESFAGLAELVGSAMEASSGSNPVFVVEEWIPGYLEFRGQVAEGEWQKALEYLPLNVGAASSGSAAPDGQQDDAAGYVIFPANGEELHVPCEVALSRPGIADIREAYFRGRKPNEGAAFFRAYADCASRETAHYMYESAGRLYRNSGEHWRALEVLDRAAELAGQPEFVDDALYHYFHAAVSASPQHLVDGLADRLSRASEPERLNNAFERLLSNIIIARRWDLLIRAYEPVREHASGRTAAQFGVAYVAALRAGLVPAPEGVNSISEAEKYLLEPAVQQPESPYYAILAAVMLGRTPPALPGESSAERDVVPGPDDDLVAGYMDFGLISRAYGAVYHDERSTGRSVTERLTRRLAREGHLLQSLRIANRLSRIEDVVVDRELSELIYPLAYERELTDVTDEYDIPRYLFYGLVREESYFDASIESWAGARGLAQLMPSTAADVARRLGVDEYDLTDPHTNLRFGGRYLSDLYRAVNRWVPALIAYNAGQGRVRRWQALRGNLPMILFHESVPLAEPRQYIRKILVSAVNYEHLYGENSVEAVVEWFFPGVTP